jgi:hypothetical protein
MLDSKSPHTGVIAFVTVAELGLSVLIKGQVLQTRLSLLGATILVSNVALWAFWVVIVYPYFGSPLRHLPRPKVYLHVSVFRTNTEDTELNLG